MDLSNYVRVGRYDLPEPTRTAAPAGNLLGQEASGVAYNWDTDTLFIVGDGGRSVTEVSKTGQLISTMTLSTGSSPQGTAFYDPEGITYIGDGQFVMTEERDRNAVKFTYEAGGTLERTEAQIANLGTFVNNTGLEGLTYDPITEGFIFVKEISPEGIFQTTIDFATNLASNGSATTQNSADLFDPANADLSDFADVFALSNRPSGIGQADQDHLLVLSQEQGRIVEVDRNGNVLSTLQLALDAGNPLSLADQQHEGLTVDSSGLIYVVSENGGGDINHPQLWVYASSKATNSAPTALALGNSVAAIAENAVTAPRIKVADVSVIDDGLGANALAVTGADAAVFEVDATGLYLKAGTALDYETKASYSVIVTVDDPTVGAMPDVSTAFTIAVIDVANEGGPASLFISEVAPWASGNAPYGADWFEVTNAGTSAVAVTGWKVDDNSNSTASAVALNGVAKIAAGESVIYVEGTAQTAAAFVATWFSGNVPAGLQVGYYSGSGIGLSTGGDALNIFDAQGNRLAGISFGASDATSPYQSFDNNAGLNGTTLPLPVAATLSEVGVNGAFVAAGDPAEIGSPGSAGKLIITEVAPWSSGNGPVGADWFEVTNTASFAIDISGWKVDDSSQSPIAAVALNGIGSVAAGESVIFLETNDLATASRAFIDTWFGGFAPEGLQFGSYSGSGVGLSTGGDALNLYDANNRLRATVSFGQSVNNATFDNNSFKDNVTLTQISSIGVNGAYTAPGDTAEIGSPGGQALLAINPVVGTSGGNALLGADNADLLTGLAGNDDLRGNGGSDILIGGAGNDTMRGGNGGDVFVFRAADGAGRDRIIDFSSEDVLLTDVQIFDSNENGTITFGRNKALDLAGGTVVTITSDTGAGIRSLEYDGIYHDDATNRDYFVYSLPGSSAGLETFGNF
ncbi:SdiA-regulated domain-containing protein [Sphingomonas sp. PB2P19]|uniref:SdiA-regulated domain-containing protein n=1 Tax=Sphingomonas rhamnosi TaxID=3096156 RepID=UPI002FC76115